MLAPLEYEGVSLMSYGFTAQALKSQASIMRGPKVASTGARRNQTRFVLNLYRRECSWDREGSIWRLI